jgi:hypothetical protein
MSDTIHLVQGDTYTPVAFQIRDKESADDWENMTPLDLNHVKRVHLKFKSLSEDRIIGTINCKYPEDSSLWVTGEVIVDEWIDMNGNRVLDCPPGTYSGELETVRKDGDHLIQTVHNVVRFKVRPEF